MEIIEEVFSEKIEKRAHTDLELLEAEAELPNDEKLRDIVKEIIEKSSMIDTLPEEEKEELIDKKVAELKDINKRNS